MTLRPTYYNMIYRCYFQHHPDYIRYGGRGITVCDSWLASYEAFKADMGERPKGYSLDRINNNGNYEPSNCRWASRKEQARNTRIQYEKGFCIAAYHETNKLDNSPNYQTFTNYIASGIPKELAIHPILGKKCYKYLKVLVLIGYNSELDLDSALELLSKAKEPKKPDKAVLLNRLYIQDTLTIKYYIFKNIYRLKVRNKTIGDFKTQEKAITIGLYIESELCKDIPLHHVLYALNTNNKQETNKREYI